MTTLYRKYRPAKWSDVIDQDHIQITLQNEIIMGTIAHAYLFSGPRGVGKTTSARLLAKAVNCTERTKETAEPCNTCTSCSEVTANRHIDVIEIDAASQTGVDNVRENIIENAQFRPTKAKYKVFIIDEVHMLSTSAFNALLKTLEEPPAHVIFVLATTELHKLPATVISRCQRFHFKKIGYEPMLERLTRLCKQEEVQVEKDVLDRVIMKSDGCLRDAESLLGQILSLNLKKITAKDAELMLPTINSEAIFNFVEHIIKNNPKEAINLLHNEINNGLAPDHFVHTLLSVLRTLLVIQMSGSTELYQAEFSERLLKNMQELAKQTETARLVRLIELALKRRLDIKTSPLPQLPLELFAAEAGLPISVPGTPQASESPKAPVKQTVVPKEAPQATKNPAPIPEKPPTPTKQATEPEPTTKKTTSQTNTQPTKATLETIQSEWSKVVEKVDVSNHSLTFILKMCTFRQLTGNELTIGVQYSFHKEKVEEQKSKRVVEQALESVLGEKIFIYCEMAPGESVVVENTELSSLASEFGGEVVD